MTQMVRIGRGGDVAPLRAVLKEEIAAFRRAQKRGNTEHMERAAEQIDHLQRVCKHPPYRIEMRQAQQDHPRDVFQKGAPLTVCFECNRLLAVMGAPYRMDHDTDESMDLVRQSLKTHDQYLEGPTQMGPPLTPEVITEVMDALWITEEAPQEGRGMAGVGLDQGFLSKVNKPVADAFMYLAGHVDAQASRIEELEEEIERIHSRLRLRQT
jgi:hypothetical protein